MWEFLLEMVGRLALAWAIEERRIGCWVLAVLLPILVWGAYLVCR